MPTRGILVNEGATMGKSYVVVDTSGAGRVVGVFSSRRKAEQVAAVNEAYYRLDVLRENRINEQSLEWLGDDSHREEMERLIRKFN